MGGGFISTTPHCEQRIVAQRERVSAPCTVDVRVSHPSTESVLTCESEVSLRHTAREAYTRFRMVDGRLEECWSPLENRWLRLSHSRKTWTLSEASGNRSSNVHVVAAERGAVGSALCGLGNGGVPVWLSHGYGVLIGIFDKRMLALKTHPLVRGHSVAPSRRATGPRQAVSAHCDEPGTSFQLHALSVPLPQVRPPAASPDASTSSQSADARAPEAATARACAARMASCNGGLRLLVGVVSHGKGLTRRGVPILRTWGRTMPTHVLVELGAPARSALRTAGCRRLPSVPSDVHERWSCHEVSNEDGYGTSSSDPHGAAADGALGATDAGSASSSSAVLSSSSAVLIRGCAGTEMAGCCRVTRWLMTVLPSAAAVKASTGAAARLGFDWLLLVDDDVYVRPDVACVLRHLDHSKPLFVPAKHAHSVNTTRQCESETQRTQLRDCHQVSICGELGPVHTRTTRLSLPAGYGALSAGFADLLSITGWLERLRLQCAASSWFYDLTLAFAAWALHVELSPLLDWTWYGTSGWLGGQKWMWSAGSVIYHKVDGGYDHPHLLHECADADGSRAPDPAALAPFINVTIPQVQYTPMLHAAASQGMATVAIDAPSGELWSCRWAGGSGVRRDETGKIISQPGPARLPPSAVAAASSTADSFAARARRAENPLLRRGVSQADARRRAGRRGDGRGGGRAERSGGRRELTDDLRHPSHTGGGGAQAQAACAQCAGHHPSLREDQWEMTLQAGDIPVCVKPYGVDMPCNTSTSWQPPLPTDACRIRDTHEAREYCRADMGCAGLVFSRDRNVATLKWRHNWMVAHEATARGWHVPSALATATGSALATSTATGLATCQQLSDRLQHEVRATGRCPKRVATLWHENECEEYATNSLYGGSAMHEPTAVCASPTAPTTMDSACTAARGRRSGCLLVVVRGHAFRLGGQFTTQSANSSGIIESQQRVLRVVHTAVLEPAQTASGWNISAVLVDAVHPRALATTWRSMCHAAFSVFRTAVRAQPKQLGRQSQSASIRSTWAWASARAEAWGLCWDAVLFLRADVAFKMVLPLPLPYSPLASAVYLPHPAPPCAGLTATPNGHRRVGDTFFYIPRDLAARLQYAGPCTPSPYTPTPCSPPIHPVLPTDRMPNMAGTPSKSRTRSVSSPLRSTTSPTFCRARVSATGCAASTSRIPPSPPTRSSFRLAETARALQAAHVQSGLSLYDGRAMGRACGRRRWRWRVSTLPRRAPSLVASSTPRRRRRGGWGDKKICAKSCCNGHPELGVSSLGIPRARWKREPEKRNIYSALCLRCLCPCWSSRSGMRCSRATKLRPLYH